MSSVPDSKFEIRVQMDRNRPWSELPPAAVGSVIQKLGFREQIRVISVCKNWRACKDSVRNPKCLPWVMSHSRTSKKGGERYSFNSELFDPYSMKVRAPVSNSVQCCMNPDDSRLYPFASKDGWVLLGGQYSTLFLHNPFTNKIIETDLEVSDYVISAAIGGSPSSPAGCKIFTATVGSDSYLYINSYSLSDESPDAESELVEERTHDQPIYSVFYMKGKLYCLLEHGRLNSYSFEDDEWKLLTEGFEMPYTSWSRPRGGWLMEIEEKLVLVCNDIGSKVYTWMIFRFDWTVMAWVAETSLESCAIFISGYASWSAPLIDSRGKKLEGCKVFYHNEFTDVARGRGFKCYSLTHETKTNEAGQAVTKFLSKREYAEWYGWISRPDRYSMCFVQPPYSGL